MGGYYYLVSIAILLLHKKIYHIQSSKYRCACDQQQSIGDDGFNLPMTHGLDPVNTRATAKMMLYEGRKEGMGGRRGRNRAIPGAAGWLLGSSGGGGDPGLSLPSLRILQDNRQPPSMDGINNGACPVLIGKSIQIRSIGTDRPRAYSLDND